MSQLRGGSRWILGCWFIQKSVAVEMIDAARSVSIYDWIVSYCGCALIVSTRSNGYLFAFGSGVLLFCAVKIDGNFTLQCYCIS